MNVALHTLGGKIYAVFYERGIEIAKNELPDGTTVRKPTPDELKLRPNCAADILTFVDPTHVQFSLHFTGFFKVEGKGPRSGLAAIYGAIPPGEEMFDDDEDDMVGDFSDS
jgi:hypothetical protein